MIESSGNVAKDKSIEEISGALTRITMDGEKESATQKLPHSERMLTSSGKSDYDDDIDSSAPTDFNDIDHIFHIDFMRSVQPLLCERRYVRYHQSRSNFNGKTFFLSFSVRFKNGTRRSCTFTNEQMRQIERENRILLNKILAQKPSSAASVGSAQRSAYQVN